MYDLKFVTVNISHHVDGWWCCCERTLALACASNKSLGQSTKNMVNWRVHLANTRKNPGTQQSPDCGTQKNDHRSIAQQLLGIETADSAPMFRLGVYPRLTEFAALLITHVEPAVQRNLPTKANNKTPQNKVLIDLYLLAVVSKEWWKYLREHHGWLK